MLKEILIDNPDDFVFNSQRVENFNSNSTRLRFWFQHCKENHEKIGGDIFEFGVFRGSSLIAMALLLKKLGSDKIVYGFDSFGGFPAYHNYDDFGTFTSYPEVFEPNLVRKHKLMMDLIKSPSHSVKPENVSSSEEFSDTSEDFVKERIEKLGLDNIRLIVGDFAETVEPFFSSYSGEIFSCNLDCDLYGGYTCALENIWEHVSSKTYIHLDEYYSLKFPGARIAVDEFVNYYDANIDATTILFPHIWEILNAAQAANIKMAVITNKRESLAAKLLFRLNIHHYFELLIGGDTLAQRKPDALPITTAIEKLASSKDHAIMLGDSEADTASARAAGVKSICVSFGYRRVSLDQLEADAIIDSFSELPDAIEKLAPSRFPKLDWPSRTKL